MGRMNIFKFFRNPFLRSACALLCSLSFVACSENGVAPDTLSNSKNMSTNTIEEVAVLTTSDGVMVIKFWPEVAPKTVENFKKLAREGFYDGTAFHRVIKGFMIQGGDPLTKDESKRGLWGTGGPGYNVRAEFNTKPHVRGVISMARSQHPDSAGSQFFICHGDARFLDRQYTAFGELIKGDEVLEAIASVPCTGPERSSPLERKGVVSVKIVPIDEVK